MLESVPYIRAVTDLSLARKVVVHFLSPDSDSILSCRVMLALVIRVVAPPHSMNSNSCEDVNGAQRAYVKVRVAGVTKGDGNTPILGPLSSDPIQIAGDTAGVTPVIQIAGVTPAVSPTT